MAESESSEVSVHLLAVFILFYFPPPNFSIEECPGYGARVPFTRVPAARALALKPGASCSSDHTATRQLVYCNCISFNESICIHFSVKPTAIAAPSQINSP